MVNYNEGKIYKLWSDTSDNLYIGSTTCPLAQRLYKHKNAIKRGLSTTAIAMREHTNIRIELIENFPCNSKDELLKREGEHIRFHRNDILNHDVAGRTKKEYYEENADKLKQHKRDWYKANVEHVRETNRIYREANREQIRENARIHHLANREKINKKAYENRLKKASTSSS